MISGAFKYRSGICHNAFKQCIFVVCGLCNSSLPGQNWFSPDCGNELENDNFRKVTGLNPGQIVCHHDRFSSLSSASQSKCISVGIAYAINGMPTSLRRRVYLSFKVTFASRYTIYNPVIETASLNSLRTHDWGTRRDDLRKRLVYESGYFNHLMQWQFYL